MNKWAAFFFIVILVACGVKGLLDGSDLPVNPGLKTSLNPALKPFYFGVASGDPDSVSVVLWTRITPRQAKNKVQVQWRICSDENMQHTVDSGGVVTSAKQDFTDKTIARHLRPASTYYYQFYYQGTPSVTGRTKTTPASPVTQLKFAVVSCNNYADGYFNGFARISEQDDLDAVIHLGDYIYEYGPTAGNQKHTSRQHQPPHEVLTLADYRTRYSQYRLDHDLQRLHQVMPFISIWDDHEIANNAYLTGAQNHQPEEGDYAARSRAARQAYFEWLPVRESAQNKLYRTVAYGPLVQWIMLDERQEARTEQLLASAADQSFQDTSRAILGYTQRLWLQNQLTNGAARWNLIGNQVIFSPVIQHQVGRSANMDAWDGYAAERQSMVDFIYQNRLANVIFLSGDSHGSWAFEVPLTLEDYRSSRRSIAVELGTPSLTSANTDERIGLDSTLWVESRLRDEQFNPHLKYLNLHAHGYVLLVVRATELLAEWRYVPRIDEPVIHEYTGHRVRIIHGIPRILQ